MTSHSRNLTKLIEQTFDIVIIGGGVSGAWLALHCSQAGYKTALLEQGDFAEKTSSASSKLLHGGIRYLQQMQFNKVRESAMERAHYLFAAPHLSKPIPFIVPTYPNFKRSKLFLFSGLCVYKALCLGENSIIGNKEQYLPPITSLSRAELNDKCDLSGSNHNGGMVFYEYHMYDTERMVLSALQTAQQQGAHIFNYIQANNYIIEKGRVSGIMATDKLTQQSLKINSKLIINSTGPWVDSLNSSLGKSATACINSFATGSHIILKHSISDHAIALTTSHQNTSKVDRGGRHVFIIPWRGHSLIGTSYDEINNTNQGSQLTADHVVQLLDAISAGVPNLNLTPDDILSGYSGLYPLQTNQANRNVYQGSGEYHIIDHADTDQHEGVITALGAKYTTAHILSARTMKLVHKKLQKDTLVTPPPVDKIKFSDGKYTSLKHFLTEKLNQYQDKLTPATLTHLVSNYGSDIDKFITILEIDPILSKPIMQNEPDILGQVYWAVSHEMALSLSDVLFRRTSVGLLGIQAKEVEQVAQIMAPLLKWNKEKTQQEIDTVLIQIKSIKQAIKKGFDAHKKNALSH